MACTTLWRQLGWSSGRLDNVRKRVGKVFGGLPAVPPARTAIQLIGWMGGGKEMAAPHSVGFPMLHSIRASTTQGHGAIRVPFLIRFPEAGCPQDRPYQHAGADQRRDMAAKNSGWNLPEPRGVSVADRHVSPGICRWPTGFQRLSQRGIRSCPPVPASLMHTRGTSKL